MSPQQKQDRLAGQQAAIAGRPFTDNPNPLSTANSRAWSKGWREVDECRVPRVSA